DAENARSSKGVTRTARVVNECRGLSVTAALRVGIVRTPAARHGEVMRAYPHASGIQVPSAQARGPRRRGRATRMHCFDLSEAAGARGDAGPKGGRVGAFTYVWARGCLLPMPLSSAAQLLAVVAALVVHAVDLGQHVARDRVQRVDGRLVPVAALARRE